VVFIMNKAKLFGQSISKYINLNFPEQLLVQYYFHLEMRFPPHMRYSGGDILFRGQCIATVETNADEQFRAIFLGPATSKSLWPTATTGAAADRIDVTPWFEIDDWLFLCDLIDLRLQRLLRCDGMVPPKETAPADPEGNEGCSSPRSKPAGVCPI